LAYGRYAKDNKRVRVLIIIDGDTRTRGSASLLYSGAAQLNTCSLVFCCEAAVVRRNPSREWEPRLTS
jgi:hypothetical protein